MKCSKQRFTWVMTTSKLWYRRRKKKALCRRLKRIKPIYMLEHVQHPCHTTVPAELGHGQDGRIIATHLIWATIWLASVGFCYLSLVSFGHHLFYGHSMKLILYHTMLVGPQLFPQALQLLGLKFGRWRIRMWSGCEGWCISRDSWAHDLWSWKLHSEAEHLYPGPSTFSSHTMQTTPSPSFFSSSVKINCSCLRPKWIKSVSALKNRKENAR